MQEPVLSQLLQQAEYASTTAQVSDSPTPVLSTCLSGWRLLCRSLC